MTTSINTMLKNRKNRKNKKGFSLVELIVVLVIMAILAAALVPTLMGYIKQSRQSNVKNEAAACVQAAQTIISSAYADSNSTYTGVGSGNSITINFGAAGTSRTPEGGTAITEIDLSSTANIISEIQYLGESPSGATVNGVKINKDTIVVSYLSYTNNGTTVIYQDGNYSVS